MTGGCVWKASLILVALAVSAPALAGGKTTATAELVVADFDSGRKPNNVGGDFGAWIKDPADPMQGAIESFDRAKRFGSKGYSLRLIYSVESGEPAYGGIWMRLQQLDARKFDSLAFRVRGDPGMGYTNQFKVELKDEIDQVSHHQVQAITDQWQDVVLPLKEFEGTTNFGRLKEFVIVIEDVSASAKRGVLYFDDVRFTNSAD